MSYINKDPKAIKVGDCLPSMETPIKTPVYGKVYRDFNPDPLFWVYVYTYGGEFIKRKMFTDLDLAKAYVISLNDMYANFKPRYVLED